MAIEEVNTLTNLGGQSAGTMTNALKIYGNGDMADGIRNVYYDGFDNGKEVGFTEGQSAGVVKGAAAAATITVAVLGSISSIVFYIQDRKAKKKMQEIRKNNQREKEKLATAIAESKKESEKNGIIVLPNNETE